MRSDIELEKKCREFLKTKITDLDSAHDLAHTQRVVANAKKLLKSEPADTEVVLAAAWLHDCVVLPKNHPDRKKASGLASERATAFLEQIAFPEEKLKQVAHAIESHSFSVGIAPETIEAKIVQDADRLDALGAVGIARCFKVGGQLGRPLYNPEDPFCESREPDDTAWTIDHFYRKLFALHKTMNTEAAKAEAEKRSQYMREFLKTMRKEIERPVGG